MGRYYAVADDETDDVANAIAEHYQPRHAGDSVPPSDVGAVVALADKIDTLAGSFALGKKPSGNRDPFGLRRAALGVVRILVERKLDVDLRALISGSLSAQPVDAAREVAEDIYEYIIDRMRGYAMERQEVTSEMFDAVRARSPSSLVDFQARLDAVAAFVAHPAANQLAAANKRIANILRQADSATVTVLDAALLSETAEQSLHDALVTAQADVAPLLKARSYADTLTRLAALQEPVDVFFDEVMVMAEDARVRENRLGLLASLRKQFLEVADISRLSVK
ncbi:MAG: glycine--tRNA ligase subunit beta, partial [Pseudomonadota bacterium]